MSKKIIIATNVLMMILLVLGIYAAIDHVEMHKHEMEGDMDMGEMDIDTRRDSFIELRDNIIGDQITEGNYRCCLEKPCTYCIEKTPGHGEGASCYCLKDVVEGVHPCGECIGEILEGHGNQYLAEYFAKAIAEKTGQEDAIKLIIEEKYGIDVEDQV